MTEDDERPQAEPENAAAEGSAAGVSALRAKLAVVGFVALVVACECSAAYLLIGGAQAASGAALTGDPELDEPLDEPAADASQPAGNAAPKVTPDIPGYAEIDLGEFMVMAPTADTGTSLMVDCQIFATVLNEDVAEFTTQFNAKKHRLRDLVIVIIRSAEPADLVDPSLSLIKRRIMVRVNELLGKPHVRGVLFSRFSFIEQQ